MTAIPPVLIPSFHLDFYRSALQEYGLLHYIVNSAIVAGSATLVTIAIGSLAAYAIARFNFTWTNFYLLLLLAISMFPADRYRRSGLDDPRSSSNGSILIKAWSPRTSPCRCRWRSGF